MASIASAQQAFYKNKNNKMGPSSAAKNKRGGCHKKNAENKFNIIDYDKGSCFLGVIKSKFSEWEAIIVDLKDDSLNKCKARNFKIKFVNVGTLVVYALNSSKSGEILAYHTNDYLNELCTYFEVNVEKAMKLCGIATLSNSVDDTEELLFVEDNLLVKSEKVIKEKGSNNDSDSMSDLAPNPNHNYEENLEDSEENLENENIEEISEKLNNISTDYSSVEKKINKKLRNNKVNKARTNKQRIVFESNFRF
jgi:hypothetical protein